MDALIAAVRAGELNDLFSQAAKTGAVGKESLTPCDVRVGSKSEGLARAHGMTASPQQATVLSDLMGSWRPHACS